MEKKQNKRAKGEYYELMAQRYLEQHQLIFIDRNFYSKTGELDLIMRDRDSFVFVEVKYRATSNYGSAQEMVTWQKQRKLQRTALFWLMKNGLSVEHTSFRFDVVAIHSQGKEINWIKNAIVEG
ncbi:YraN family protein [Aliivibrio sp. S3MY1]|uniref:YraN family protein n=1 Tax=unclassified Aliivibrio TaxID=2645654 RepID=UPI00237959D4|nr:MULTISPECIES: YraN family protein [unclassified Aliivibrio]MDD9195247.1 YraN family protein [Aliivibrio sp. S3MY1]MDD9197812.1 YraN family protein [Aliivibrio sp. S2MY1]